MDKRMTASEAVAQIEGLSRRIRSTARIFSSTTNQPTLSNWWALRLFFQPLGPTWLKVRDLTTSSAKEISFLIATVPKNVVLSQNYMYAHSKVDIYNI